PKYLVRRGAATYPERAVRSEGPRSRRKLAEVASHACSVLHAPCRRERRHRFGYRCSIGEVKIVGDPQRERLFLRWQRATEERTGNESVDENILTAEDWEAARRALGPGSKSLLFGTSTKVLDSIAQRFKRQAPTSDAPSQSDQESSNPTPRS